MTLRNQTVSTPHRGRRTAQVSGALFLTLLLAHSAAVEGLEVEARYLPSGFQGLQAMLDGEGEYSNWADPDLPAVLLLDIGLPRLSGLEVLERVRADPSAEPPPEH
jgi:CheY-like chemotaxis protein